MTLAVPTFSYPGIYKPVMNPRTKQYNLEFISNNFNVPDHYYGEVQKYLDYYSQAFKKQNFSSGVILTGLPGSGKTALGKSLCNFCILNGLKVINLNNVQYRDELIQFLDTLTSVVFFFDEMGKTFHQGIQEKMLTMLSNNLYTERITIITENNPNLISSFIRNRPGRIRYAKHFSKISKETVIEVANDMGCTDAFLDELLKDYDGLTVFTFDHLKALLTEHKFFPDMSFKQIVEYLNLEFMSGVKTLKLVSYRYKDKNIPIEDVIVRPKKVLLSLIENGGVIMTEFPLPKQKEKDDTLDNNGAPLNRGFPSRGVIMDQIKLTTDDLTLMDDTTVEYKTNDAEVTFEIILSKPSRNDDFF